MRTPAEAQRRLETANPVISASTKPAAAWSSAVLLERIDRRSGDMQTQDKPIIEKSPKEGTGRRNIALALGAAVIVAVVGVGALLVADDGSDVVGPAGVIEDYTAAFNAGDIDAVMALFSEESVLSGHPFGIGFESTGLSAIRALQVEGMGITTREDALTISNVEVTGNTVTWDDVLTSDGGAQFCIQGHSAVVEDGKILTWAWPGGGVDCP